jgi:HTH-type transcriptional regulator / antitoxin HipB
MDVTDGRQLQALARDRRLTLGLSQETLASKSGVSRKWVSEFELGKTSADLTLVLRLLKALDLRLQVVFPEEATDIGARATSSHTIDLDALLDGGQP